MEGFVFDPKRILENREQGPTAENEDGLAPQVLSNVTYGYCYYPVESEECLICLNCGQFQMESMAGYDDDAYYQCECCAGFIPLHTPQHLENLLYLEGTSLSNAQHEIKKANITDKLKKEFDIKFDELTTELIEKTLNGHEYGIHTPKKLQKLITQFITKSAEDPTEGPEDPTEGPEDPTEGPEDPEVPEEKLSAESSSYKMIQRGCFERLKVNELELPENVANELKGTKIVYKFGLVKVERYGRLCKIYNAIFSRCAEYFHVFEEEKADFHYSLDCEQLFEALSVWAEKIRQHLANDVKHLEKFNAIMKCYNAAKIHLKHDNRHGQIKFAFELADILDIPLCSSPNAPITPDGGEMAYCGKCLQCDEQVYGFMSAD